MNIGEKKTILSDVNSLSKAKTIYSKKGESVIIISISLPVVLVENLKGEKFSVRIKNIL